jgi:hypothetical protein
VKNPRTLALIAFCLACFFSLLLVTSATSHQTVCSEDGQECVETTRKLIDQKGAIIVLFIPVLLTAAGYTSIRRQLAKRYEWLIVALLGLVALFAIPYVFSALLLLAATFLDKRPGEAAA